MSKASSIQNCSFSARRGWLVPVAPSSPTTIFPDFLYRRFLGTGPDRGDDGSERSGEISPEFTPSESNASSSSSSKDSSEDPVPESPLENSNFSLDEKALLKEYFESFEEEVWKSEGDHPRDVRWMEMLGNRGKEGVFDLEEFVEVLKSENVVDICCIRIPPEFNYADYFVIGNGFSLRHIKSVAAYVKKLHKAKRWKKDPSVLVEGELAGDWLAMDMGNIVLHLFMEEKRKEYDIEALWCLGEEWDEFTLQARQLRRESDEVFVDDDDDLRDWDLNDNDDEDRFRRNSKAHD